MSRRVEHERFIDEVMGRTGIGDRRRAEAAAEATLEALGEHLAAGDARRVGGALPRRLAGWLVQGGRRGGSDVSALFDRVGEREGVGRGFAVEHAGAVCQALAGLLDPETWSFLRVRLPPAWAVLLEERERGASPDVAPPGALPGHGTTLATGKPGSRRPLSEAAPPGPQSESVARSADPHGESKLSGGAIRPSENVLAGGRPGSARSLSEGGKPGPRG